MRASEISQAENADNGDVVECVDMVRLMARRRACAAIRNIKRDESFVLQCYVFIRSSIYGRRFPSENDS